jgi:hypothetical protein
MARTKSERDGRTHGPGGLTSWINRTLLPWLGPPPLGPYPEVTQDEVQAARTSAVCPICGELMSRHEIDRSGERTFMQHPDPEEPQAA